MSGGVRASSTIPNNVKKTIQNIKEITGNHSDEEIYAMLKDCSMDPNETTQKLLLQDTFHEVKRKKDRKKENQTGRDIVDSWWRPGPPGRGDRGGRGNFTSRYAAPDAGGGRSIPAKENGIAQSSNKAGSISSPPVQETKRKEDRSSVIEMPNGPVNVVSGGNKGANTLSGAKELEPQARSGGSKKSNMVSGVNVESILAATSPAVGSNDTDVPAGAGTIKRDVGIQHSHVEPNSNTSPENKSNAGKVGAKSHAVKNQSTELLQPSSLSHGSSSRPSSNYGSRSQQALGSQKVGPNKEWKPKVTNTNTVQGLKTPAAPEGSNKLAESFADTQSVENITDSACATNKLEKELEGLLHVKDAQHVIIPNHIHVPDAVRTGLSFGSFDATFVIASKTSSESEAENLKSVSETEQAIEETVEEAASQSTLSPEEEVDYVGSQSPKPEENLSSGDVNAPSNSVPDFSDSKETVSGPQHSNVHTSTHYNFGLLPPMLGNPLGSPEASETQLRDASRASSFVIQQPVDPSSFYAQFYRSGADSDGRVSPFPAHLAAAKYNGNVAVLPSQTPTEGGNSMVLSTAAQTPLVTQAAGVMPNSIGVTQQPMPHFRQPAGVHIPHYPPNYLPYGHYFPPFYVPPPAMHQFLGNHHAFPQQAQPGNVYPAQPAPAVGPTAVKFPMSQYKPASNTGNSMHMGIGGGYGPYGASPVGYSPVSASTAGNSTANEDHAASQYKDNNMYITGQQSEGSTVWIPAPGRDIANLPANSFYNLPQGQHVTFAPTQAGQGTFAGIYHPAQAVTAASVHPFLQQSQAMPGAVDMAGATANVYQQSQHAQMNWPNNY
ncbi:GBF-interacting protein 1-like [Chenopodium quinoa]|uniref:GBF-interacting protein 1-like n=1 Tax=Chenopodium quinoa TaxID=63459 RepID=UPI000B78B895|nr:GBF-interacting protein 1-like [Chenopodium quinoa]